MRETRSRILSLILTLAILSTFIVTPAFASSSEDKWDGSVASSFAGGSGTEPNPYLIATGAQLAYLAKIVNADMTNAMGTNNKYYKLVADIDLNNIEWTPIGINPKMVDDTQSFGGVFDGQNHTIRNLKITANDKGSIGLFGNVTAIKSTTINLNNFKVENANITTTDCSDDGIAVGDCRSIKNVHVSGNIHADGTKHTIRVGGVTGHAYDIYDCSSDCTIYASSVPFISNGEYTISACNVGGISSYGGEFYNCKSTGQITTESVDGAMYIGGISGTADAGSIMNNCSSTMGIKCKDTASKWVEGLAVGGLSGKDLGSLMSNCEYTGSINVDGAATYVGGIAGYYIYKDDNHCVMKQCHSNATINLSCTTHDGLSTVSAGGLIGYSLSPIIEDCYSEGSVDEQFTGDDESHPCAGGLIGYCESDKRDSTIDRCYSLCRANCSINTGDPGTSDFLAWCTADEDKGLKVVIKDCISQGGLNDKQWHTEVTNSDQMSQGMFNQSSMEQKNFDFTNVWKLGPNENAVLRNVGANITIQEPTNDSPMDAVKVDSWASPEVAAAYNRKMLDLSLLGNDFTHVTTRLQFCDIVVRMIEAASAKTLDAAPAGTFTDCDSVNVLKAYKAGIVNGVGDNKFDPNGELDRQTLSTMLSRAFVFGHKFITGNTAPNYYDTLYKYPDKSSVASWAYDGVARLAGMGIMAGTTDGSGNVILAPAQKCTIEQCSVLAFRTFDKLIKS